MVIAWAAPNRPARGLRPTAAERALVDARSVIVASGTVNTLRGTGSVDTMWNRREQHQAYRFLIRRIVSAMLSGEPETNELPMRRFTVALAAGLALAVLLVAGVTVYGLIFPGGGKPAENTIIVER